MGKCLKCNIYKFVQFGRRAIAKLKDPVLQEDSDVQEGKYNKKKVKIIYLWEDVYEGKNIEENKKSIAYSLSFGKQDRTLTDEEVNEIMNKVIENLKNKIGAEVRS